MQEHLMQQMLERQQGISEVATEIWNEHLGSCSDSENLTLAADYIGRLAAELLVVTAIQTDGDNNATAAAAAVDSIVERMRLQVPLVAERMRTEMEATFAAEAAADTDLYPIDFTN